MNVRKLIALTLVLGLLLPAIAAAAPLHSAPLRDFVARPCAPGASYDPACDVDHDGDVDLFDIQKTAGHWNQSGIWTSDNNHDHLGQVWTGNDNPLAINGSFGLPTLAPLALSNSLGYGLSIPTTGLSGVAIGTTGSDGVFVNSAGSPSTVNANPGDNGFEVAGAENNGLWVGRADDDGIHVQSVGGDGVYVDSADYYGMYILSAGNGGVYVYSAGDDAFAAQSAGDDGVSVNVAGDDGMRVTIAGSPSSHLISASSNGFEIAGAEGYGVYVGRADIDGVAVDSAGADGFDVNAAGDVGIEAGGANYAGYFIGDIFVAGSCFGCLLATYAVNVGDRPLAPGDVVALAGLRESDFDTGPLLLEVVPAEEGQPLVGVVSGRAELALNDDPQPGESGQRLAPRDGPAAPGDHVTVVYAGPIQVKVSAGGRGIEPGARLTASDRPGAARALRTVTVNGVELAENASIIGVALEPLAAVDGLIWVLVNVQ